MDSNFVTFGRPDEHLGDLSNLHPNYPVAVNGIRLPTVEHLFHILRYRSSMIQSTMMMAENPVTARRMFANKRFDQHRCPVWKDNTLEIMEFCLRTKLVWNWVRFGNLLRSTEDKTIYMVSTVNKFWGVRACNDGFVGENHMGRLLMKLRDELVSENNESLRFVTPPSGLDLTFLGQPIQVKDRRDHLRQVGTRTTEMVNALRP